MAEYQYPFIYIILHSQFKQMALSQGDTELNWATDWLVFDFIRIDKWDNWKSKMNYNFFFTPKGKKDNNLK